jgi:hypothetical protein
VDRLNYLSFRWIEGTIKLLNFRWIEGTIKLLSFWWIEGTIRLLNFRWIEGTIKLTKRKRKKENCKMFVYCAVCGAHSGVAGCDAVTV